MWSYRFLLTLTAVSISGCVFYPTKFYVPYADGAKIGSVGLFSQWHDSAPSALYREDGCTLWVYAPERGKIELATVRTIAGGGGG
jgi:hypothetical protein